MQNRVSVEEWVAMFQELGLAESRMDEWHRIFESRHPEGHQGFLEWLGLPQDRIAQIRSRSR